MHLRAIGCARPEISGSAQVAALPRQVRRRCARPEISGSAQAQPARRGGQAGCAQSAIAGGMDSQRRARLLRRLHALGAARGLTHQDLRAICGVDSLGAVSVAQLQAGVAALDRPPRADRPPSKWRCAATYPRSTWLATQSQLDAVADLLAAVQRVAGWSDDLVAGWLWKRQRIRWSSAAKELDRRLASQLITELSNILAKGRGASPSRRCESTARGAAESAEIGPMGPVSSRSFPSASPHEHSSPEQGGSHGSRQPDIPG